MAVAPKEIGEPKDVRVVLVADDDWSSTALDQADAAQNQGAHQLLAEIGFGNQQGAEAIGRNRYRLDIGQRFLIDEVRTPRKLGELAHEIAALVGDDVGRLRTVWLSRFD